MCDLAIHLTLLLHMQSILLLIVSNMHFSILMVDICKYGDVAILLYTTEERC